MAEAGNNANSITKDRHLHLAAVKGDWKFAQTIQSFSENISRQITENGETALHIAAIAEHVGFVKKLVKGQSVADISTYLRTTNHSKCTALFYASMTGNVKIAKVMVEKLQEVNQVNGELVRPLIAAAQSGHRKMVDYLLSQCEVGQWIEDDQFKLFIACIENSLYDVAVRLLQENPHLAYLGDENYKTALHALTWNPLACDGESKLGMWRKYINSCKKERRNLVKELCKHAFNADRSATSSPTSNGASSLASIPASNVATDVENTYPETEILSLLFIAAEVGNLEVLIELIRFDPRLVWKVDDKRGTIFHVAVRQRHESIFGLLSELGQTKYLIAQCVIEDGHNNITQKAFETNILHLAAESAPQDKVNVASGAALQMQREMLWFKEVEKIVPHSYKRMENSSSMTPQAFFEKNHKELRKQGEQWMKDTATSSTVVATLIATVMFGAAFNVPGGFHDPSGVPNLKRKNLFLVFFIADALSLFCSSTSALMFLSILTSRYAYMDFLRKLPFKLMIGITLLFVSVAAMMVAFCAIFLLYYPDILGSTLMLAVFYVYACVPILYLSLKYSLLVDLMRAIYRPRSLFQPPKRLLY